jgi:hypothetical protein
MIQPSREPFEWLTDRPHRRGALRQIRTAIRRGWLDGPEMAQRRAALMAALMQVQDDPHSTLREHIALAKIYIEMSELD